MPSFPDSVKSFTTKNTGDTIQAAHVNDLQDEVNAIEAGYRNATAPLNSSNSTLASLSAGASTLTALTVSGNAALAGALSVVGGSTFVIRPVTPPPDAALLVMDTDIIMGSSNQSTLVFQVQSVLTNSSMHSTATNPGRLIPQSTGFYQATAMIAFSSTEAGYRAAIIADSSGAAVSELRVVASSRANRVQVVAYKRFDVLGGYLTVLGESLAHSTMTITASGSWFALHKL